MKKVLVVLAAAFATVAFAGAAKADIVVTGDNADCSAAHFPEKIDGTSGGPTASGITMTGNDELVTVNVPAGVTVEHICVKTGQSGDAQVNTTVPFVGPGSFTIEKTGSGGGISHVQFGTSTGGTDTDTGGPTTDTGGPTTDTGGPTTDTGGPTTDTGGPTTTAGPTTTGTGGISGSTTGGTTGGTASTGGELPFTGLPMWIPLLAAAALLASGIFLVRRKKGELS